MTQEQLIKLSGILARQSVGVMRTDTVEDWMDFNREWRKFNQRSLDRFPRAVRCTVSADVVLRLMGSITLGSMKDNEIEFLLELKDLAAAR